MLTFWGLYATFTRLQFVIWTNTEYAGLDIAVILCIASRFSRRIETGNAGPTSTLESMGAKWRFRCILFKYCSNLQTVSEKKFCLGPPKLVGVGVIIF